ncbi:transposase [Pectobacterium cacticida]
MEEIVSNKWQISDELWEKMAPLIPEHKTHHPLGTHRKRVDNRAAMNAIFFGAPSMGALLGVQVLP